MKFVHHACAESMGQPSSYVDFIPQFGIDRIWLEDQVDRVEFTILDVDGTNRGGTYLTIVATSLP